ncbi:RteC domain-containing protein [Chitinophaga sp.]|uniref:RteC domain-containing protein n=1 Tax=Chitinophaga sp. TaxID=1869181 RepID=UPI0031D58DAF
MQDGLAEIRLEKSDNILLRARSATRFVGQILAELKTYIISYQFADEEEEIEFFKNIFPEFNSLLIFNTLVTDIEMRVPEAERQLQRHFYKDELQTVHFYFKRNSEAYAYYRSLATHSDRQYFLRATAAEQPLLDEHAPHYDPRFYTAMTYRFATIKAHGLLRTYIEGRIDTIEGKTIQIPHPLHFKLRKVYLAELIFALEAVKAFGNLSTRIVVETICRDWNCSIANIYKTYEEICLRKKEKFPFLKMLLLNAERRAEDFFDNK